MFKEYYIGRKGIYHNKNIVIIESNYELAQYQDFGLNFNNLEITIYYEDGSKQIEKLKGNMINIIKLYKIKNKK